jgi:glycosyltransferase involved in cell wall biosynthesis
MVTQCRPAPASPDDSPTQRLRVAMITETYPPEVNGVAVTVSHLVHGLLRHGHCVQLVRPRQGTNDIPQPLGSLDPILTRGLPIPRYPELKVGLPAHRRLAQLWRLHRPDIVHIATEGPLGWSALRTAGRLGIPTVSEFRTNFHAYSRHYGIGVFQGRILSYLRSFHNRTGCTMVPTATLGHELAASGFDRLRVVARGVDTSLFNPSHRSTELRSSWGASTDSLVVTAVGRLAPEKNLGLLVQSFQRIQQFTPSARLVLVGDGPSRESLRKRLPNAVFAGKRLGEDLGRHYASADLLLFPSVTETYGNVTPEAMASALGVVAFNYGAAGELIEHESSGWLAPFSNDDDFIQTAVSATRDITRLRKVGRQALRTAAGLGWDRIISQVLDIYRSIAPVPDTSRPSFAFPNPPHELLGQPSEGQLPGHFHT